RFGLPDHIVSDNGPQFRSLEFREFLKRNGVKQSFSPPYHPATNGAAENFVKTFKDKDNQWTPGLVEAWFELLDEYWRDFLANYVALLEAATTATADAVGNVYASAETDYSCTRRGPRLPSIIIPQFSGRREDWESFRDLFKALVHNEPQLTDVERLYYLKSLVQGDAKAAIDTVQTVGTNYSTAWSLLKTRYEHRRLLVHDHLSAFRSIKPMREESTEGRPVDHWDDWFVSLTTTSLDPATRRAWEDDLEKLEASSPELEVNIATFTVLASFLRRECRALRSVEASRETRAPVPSSSRTTAPSSATRSFHTLATQESSLICPICHGAHYLGHCSEFQGLNATAKKNVVFRERLCFNYWKRVHSVKDCPSKSVCQHCRATHHSLLNDGQKRHAECQNDTTPAKHAKREDKARSKAGDGNPKPQQ
ncbi:uncharacterized protein LOC106645854, partial [Copidosoma floridanum]|uniref:uncharacterized protein LOC106645854 n=1 Tax=Copidosoma floridanum TaxID=29053 RepID=UPI0006C96723